MRKEKARRILSEVIAKTEMYQSVRRVRAPTSIERALELETPQMRQGTQQSPTISPGSTALPPLQGRMLEYRLLNTAMTEHAFYAPDNSKPAAAACGISPQSSDTTSPDMRTRGGSFGSCNSPRDAMLDVDWVRGRFKHSITFTNKCVQNEWDKLFPPDVNLSDFGNLPDFQFSIHIPNQAM